MQFLKTKKTDESRVRHQRSVEVTQLSHCLARWSAIIALIEFLSMLNGSNELSGKCGENLPTCSTGRSNGSSANGMRNLQIC